MRRVALTSNIRLKRELRGWRSERNLSWVQLHDVRDGPRPWQWLGHIPALHIWPLLLPHTPDAADGAAQRCCSSRDKAARESTSGEGRG